MDLFHRVGIIDDFRNLHAFLEVRIYGELELVSISISSGPKEFTTKEHSIGIFVNYKLVHETKERKEAVGYLNRILSEVPQQISGYVKEFRSEILKAIE